MIGISIILHCQTMEQYIQMRSQDPKEGYSSTVTELVVVTKIEEVVLENRWLLMLLLREMKISRESVYHMLEDITHKIKVAAMWFSRLLTPFQKQYMQ